MRAGLWGSRSDCPGAAAEAMAWQSLERRAAARAARGVVAGGRRAVASSSSGGAAAARPARGGLVAGHPPHPARPGRCTRPGHRDAFEERGSGYLHRLSPLRRFSFPFASPVGEGAQYARYREKMQFPFASRDSSSVGVSLSIILWDPLIS